MTPWKKVPIGMQACEVTPGRVGVAFKVDSHMILDVVFELAYGTVSVT